jgi:two-component system sensor histidine kinase KdpD
MRQARALGGDCLAVHVDTGTTSGTRERRRLDDNLCLARSLGASVEVLPAGDLASTILEVARERNASLVVVGRSGLVARSIPFLNPAVSERIVRSAGAIAVAVVQDSGPLEVRRPARRALVGRLAILVLAVALITTGIQALGVPASAYRSVALLYLAAIVGLSYVASPAFIVGGAIASALALNFFFIPPYFTFSIGSPEDWILFTTYFVVAFATGGLVSRLRSRERLLAQRQRASSFLARAGEELASVSSTEDALAQASSLASEYFALEVEFNAGDSGERGVAEHGGRADGRGDATADPLSPPRSGETRVLQAAPAQGGRPGIVAKVDLPRARVWTAADDELLSSLGKTLALILERERSEEDSRRSALELGSQRLAKVLLDSVSHEIRTPLTTITGSLSALRDDLVADKVEARKAILEGALAAASSLDRIVEDLLSAGRIESNTLRLKRESVDASEIAQAALDDSRPALAGRELGLSLPLGTRRFSVDAALVARLVSNLLRNAGKYSRPRGRVELVLAEAEGALRVRVVDDGPGVPEPRRATMFDKFRREEPRQAGGLGLGLAICRGIAEAHGGDIRAGSEGERFFVEARLPALVTDEERGRISEPAGSIAASPEAKAAGARLT